MHYIPERGSTHVYRVNKISAEEIHGMVERCVHEHPPFCNAACPLKLDAKSLMKAAAAGDFKKARQIYEKIAPFPWVLSAGCDAPCEGKCRLGEVGEAISLRAVERAVLQYGEKSRSSGVFRMKKRKSVAVFGSGLFCLLLAGELEKKAYPVTVFCAEADREAWLRTAAPFLTGEAFEAERKNLAAKDIDFVFDCPPDAALFAEKRAGFDVLCASEEAALRFFPDAVCSDALMVFEREKLVMGPERGVTETAFAAKKAALSVDRLAQNLDPNNTRGEEGAVESRLYTDLSEVRELERVPIPPEGYSKEEAVREASRCLQCACEECFKGCSFLRHYKKDPGLLGREIYNNTQIIMGDHQLTKPMNSCSLCGQCTVTCPNGYDMARVCRVARQNMVSTGKMSNAPHEFALLDLFFSNEDAFLSRPQPGFAACKYVFFPGCQASAIAPETVKAAYLDLCERLDGGVALMLGCCGAICDWAGREEISEETFAFLENELARLGNPTIIAGCPTCRGELKAHRGQEVIGIWDVLAQIGLPAAAQRFERPAALHDSCGARGDSETQRAIRALAASLGVELVETPYSGDRSPCCGYGGLASYANKEVAQEMTEACLARSDAPYISYCMACRDRFAREGRESRHILELVYGTDAGAPPDISEKRYNRLKLRGDLLRELWGEEVEEVELPYTLTITPEALRMMDERMILKSDVIAVLNEMRETNEAIADADTGLSIARSRLGNVTFWVKFREIAGGYEVVSAYSHRMMVERRPGNV